MRSLEVLCHLDQSYGGIVSTVPRMAAEVRRSQRWSSQVLCFVTGRELSEAARDPNVRLLPMNPIMALIHGKAAIADSVHRADVVHVHGLWHPCLLFTASTALRIGRPLIVSPHGMLDDWALRLKAWKKRLVSSTVQRRLLASASCVRALTAAEAADCARYARCSRIEVIPNGVALPPKTSKRLNGDLPDASVMAGKRIVTFLGRLHQKKGIDMLLKVWPDVAALHPEILLVLAGRDEGNFASRPLPERCIWVGHLGAEHRGLLLKATSLFVLPSFSEGFSMAVLEALASSRPVLISDRCHFPEVEASGSGLICSANPESLRASLISALARDAQALQAWGTNGRRLVEERYTEQSVAARLVQLYGSVTTEPAAYAAC